MRRISLAITAIFLCACQNEADSHADKRDPNLDPVTEADALTVGALRAEGYVIIDYRERAGDCGIGCYADGFDAVYLGREGGPDAKETLAEYACPELGENADDWKCRALNPPYVPNAGFKPNTP